MLAAAQRRGELTWRRRVDSMTRGLLPKKRGRKAKDTVSAESAQRTRSVATVAIGKALEALGARNGEKARALNSALLKLPNAVRDPLRNLGYVQQERFLGVRDACDTLGADHFNTFNALDLRTATGTSVRTMVKYNHMCAYTEAANGGNRRAVLPRLYRCHGRSSSATPSSSPSGWRRDSACGCLTCASASTRRTSSAMSLSTARSITTRSSRPTSAPWRTPSTRTRSSRSPATRA